MRPSAAALILVAAAAVAAQSAPKKTPTAGVPLDFTGYWKLDASLSQNVNPMMKNATLSVTQKGNRIWLSPGADVKRGSILSEEIVVDGKPYEKFLGPAGKGVVTAEWAPDRQSLRIESRVGTQGDSKNFAVQRSIWKLSSDRTVWVRESASVSPGRPSTTRLVFRKVPPPTPTVPPTRGPKPAKSS